MFIEHYCNLLFFFSVLNTPIVTCSFALYIVKSVKILAQEMSILAQLARCWGVWVKNTDVDFLPGASCSYDIVNMMDRQLFETLATLDVVFRLAERISVI